MPRSFSNQAARRPDVRLFNVPTLPEKQSKDELEEGDDSFISDLKGWIDTLLTGDDEPSTSMDTSGVGVGTPIKLISNASLPNPGLLLTAYDQAMIWGTKDPKAPINGVKPPCTLSGAGAAVNTGAAVAPPPVPLDDHIPAEEAVFEVSAADAVVVKMYSPNVYGYSSAEMLGQPILLVTHPEERASMHHALQVLLRMSDIMRASGMPVSKQNIRVIHRVHVGLGRSDRRATVVSMDSIITLGTPPAPGKPPNCIIRSKKAVGPFLGGHFQMLPA